MTYNVMAGLIKRRNGYYAQFCEKGRSPERKRLSLRTEKKSEARKRLADLEERYEAGTFDPWYDDPRAAPDDGRSHLAELVGGTTGEIVEAFLDTKREERRSPNTIRTYAEVLSLFVGSVGEARPLAKIGSREVSAFIQDGSVSGATRHKRFGHLRTFFRWADREGLIRSNPLDGVAKPKKPHKIPKAVTPKELGAICEAIRADYEAKRARGTVLDGELVWRIPLFRFGFYTGLRASELARLRWKHLDFGRGLVFIYEQKNGKQGTIPLNAKAREALGGVERGEPDAYVFLPPNGLDTERATRPFVEKASKAFREARGRAGIERKVSLHGLRHGFCTALAEAGKSAMVIQAAARHADISTSARYVHIANEALKSELDDVFG